MKTPNGGHPGLKFTRPYSNVCILGGESASIGEWESPRDEETVYVNVDEVQRTLGREYGSKHTEQLNEQAEIPVAIDDSNVMSSSEMDNGSVEMDAIDKDQAEYMNIEELLSKRGSHQRQGNCLHTSDAATGGGGQEDVVSSTTNTPQDVDVFATDEYIDMKTKRLLFSDKEPLDSEKTSKPTIQSSIKSCLMQNKELYELSKLPDFEMKLESLISDITEVCQRAINEKDVVERPHENDDSEKETGYLEMVHSQPHYEVEGDENLKVEGGSVDNAQNSNDVNIDTVLEKKSCKTDDEHYDYAYGTRQSIRTKILRSNESLTESNKKSTASFRCNDSFRNNHRMPQDKETSEMSDVNTRNMLDGSMADKDTDSNVDADSIYSYSYAYSERVTFLEEVFRTNARDTTTTITESRSHYPLETVTKESNKLLQWAVESGIRRIKKAKFSAEDDKVFINSYEDIDTIPITIESSGYSFCDNLKLKLIVGCLFILPILILVFLIIIYPNLG